MSRATALTDWTRPRCRSPRADAVRIDGPGLPPRAAVGTGWAAWGILGTQEHRGLPGLRRHLLADSSARPSGSARAMLAKEPSSGAPEFNSISYRRGGPSISSPKMVLNVVNAYPAWHSGRQRMAERWCRNVPAWG